MDLSAWPIFVEIQKDFYISVAPAIYSLLVVPYYREVAMSASEKFYKFVLLWIDVLIFIHKNCVKARLILFQNMRVGEKEGHRFLDEVVKIKSVVPLKRLFVVFISLYD